MQKSPCDDTRALILVTAKILLRRFGEDKMTVVDIARAAGMSHANVYRFFKNKSEILDAIINEWLLKVEAFVEAIAARPVSAAERLESVVLELHRKRRQKLVEDAEVFETFRRMIELRPDAIAKRREKVFAVFKRLIEAGIEAGEFAPVDCHEAATVLKDATSMFLHPLMIPTALNQRAEVRAQNVIRYILAGFSAKSERAPVGGHAIPVAETV